MLHIIPKRFRRPHPGPPHHVTSKELHAALEPIKALIAEQNVIIASQRENIADLAKRVAALEALIGTRTPGTADTLEERVATLESLIS